MSAKIAYLLLFLLIQIDGVVMSLPVALQAPGITIYQHGFYSVLQTNFGLTVNYDLAHSLFVTLSPKYQGQMCGLCGDFNGIIDDDLVVRNGSVVKKVLNFVTDWESKTGHVGVTDSPATLPEKPDLGIANSAVIYPKEPDFGIVGSSATYPKKLDGSYTDSIDSANIHSQNQNAPHVDVTDSAVTYSKKLERAHAGVDGSTVAYPVFDKKRLVESKSLCWVIQNPDGPFGFCHSQVDPEMYWTDCILDLYISAGASNILCQAIQTYVAVCQRANVTVLPWRTKAFCGKSKLLLLGS